MKRLALIIGIIALLLVSLSHAQQTWQRTYGGPKSEWGPSVQQTQDGGFIIGGITVSFGAGLEDVYLIKTNAQGDTLWTRTYGGTDYDFGLSVQQTQDGGYVIAGGTYSFDIGGGDVYLIKTNASGDTLWTRVYGGAQNEAAYSVQQTLDGGYIIAGRTASFGAGNDDVYLVKTNAQGDTLWTKAYGGPDYEWGYSVCQTRDSGYVVVGWTTSFGAGGWDVYLIKTNSQGDTLWTRTYGGTRYDDGSSVQQTQDGGYIIAGGTESLGDTLGNVYLLKTNAQGDTLWTRTYGGANGDGGSSVQQTQDGGYIIAGGTGSFGAGLADVYLIKTNVQGDTLWTRTYGRTNYDGGECVQQTQDMGYIISGYTWSFGDTLGDVYLIKTDANGNVGVETPVRPLDGSTVRPLKATPNPFTSFATLPGHEAERFSLYDVSGRRVGTYRGDRVGEGLKAGVYFLRSSDNKDKPLRVVKVR